MRIITGPPGIEIWMPIKGFEQTYEVSNLGRIRSLSRLTKFGIRQKYIEGKILKIKRLKPGHYPCYILCQNNKRYTFMAHRLVAENFLPNPNNLKTVNHKDGNKHNNYVGNLEWCSYSDNLLHALDTGLIGRRKLTADDVRQIRRSSLTDIELGKIYNVRKGNIWNIRKFKSWNHVS